MEEAAFTQAVKHYQDMVYRVALNALGSPQDADDATQEAFLRLFRERKPFESEEYLRRWLIRVTVNLCHDMGRSPWKRRRVSLEDAPEIPVFDERSERNLYQAVMALPEKYRVPLYLFYYEELSTKEIAGILGLKQSAVTTRLSRARALLKERMGEVWSDD